MTGTTEGQKGRKYIRKKRERDLTERTERQQGRKDREIENEEECGKECTRFKGRIEKSEGMSWGREYMDRKDGRMITRRAERMSRHRDRDCIKECAGLKGRTEDDRRMK